MANIKQAVKLGVFTLAIIPTRTSCRGRIWNEFGLLLSFRSYRIPYSDITRCGGIGCHVPRQTGWCVPLGRRSVRKEIGIPCHLGTMD